MEKQKILAITSVLLLISLSIGLAQASGEYSGTVGYIVLNSLDTSLEQRYVDIIQDLGLTVEFIDDSQILSKNFSSYRFIVVGEGTLANNNRIPVNFVPSLITNTKHLSIFNWSTTIVQTSPNPYMIGRVNNQSHFITYGFPQDFTEYNQTFIGDVALSPITRATRLKIIVSHPQSTNDGVVATADVGTILKNGFVSKAKGLFFGINKPQYWSAYSETIFRSSVIWLLTDFNAPTISGINITGITSEGATVSWGTDKASNYTFSYGKNGQLTTMLTDAAYTMSKSITLNGLDEKSSYSFTIKACNLNGYCSTSNVQSFTTKDITSPAITSNTISGVTNTSAIVSVSSNELSRYYLYIGTAPGSIAKIGEDTLPKSSTDFTLNGLSEHTQYYHMIEVCDTSANCVNSSLQSFTTLDFTAPGMPVAVELSVLNPGNKIRISWQTPAGEAPSAYNIYQSNHKDLINFNLSVAAANVPGNEYIDETASTSQQRYYIVRAIDASGNEDQNTIIFAKYDIELQSGYNLISFPITLQNPDISAAMHSNAAYHPVSEIKTYNPELDAMQTATFNGNEWNTLQLDTLSSMNGYIFRSDSITRFTVVGYPSASNQISIKSGMNLLGLTAAASKSISDVYPQTAENHKIKEVAKRDSEGRFTVATYYPESNEWSNAFSIEAGKAYWLKADQDFILGVE